MGQQRIITPFNLKESIACVVSVNHRWRTFSRLFRLMLERISPAMAEIEVADGGPALPMRVSNFYRFGPYWLDVSEKLIWGVARRYLGKSLWKKRDPGTDSKAYPIGRWRRETLSQLEDEELLVPANMHSAALYDEGQLRLLLTKAKSDDFRQDGLLSRIITVEMAFRSTGITI
jgi:hypothetical protein